MDRRIFLRGVIGVAVATGIPAMPFEWHEANPSLEDIVTRTIRENMPSMIDTISKTNVLLDYLRYSNYEILPNPYISK